MSAAPTPPLDLAFVRAQFPALAGDWVFLDNAGGSQILGRVVDRISDYLKTTNVQLGASYAISQRAGERLQEAQRRDRRVRQCRPPGRSGDGPDLDPARAAAGPGHGAPVQPRATKWW